MRRIAWKASLLGAALLGVMGCRSTRVIQAPPLVEEHILPPQDDPRFHDPHYTYPKESLNQFDTGPKSTQPLTPGGPGPGMRLPNQFGPMPTGR